MPKRPEVDEEAFIKAYQSGKGLNMLAALHGIGKVRAKAILVKHGIELRTQTGGANWNASGVGTNRARSRG